MLVKYVGKMRVKGASYFGMLLEKSHSIFL